MKRNIFSSRLDLQVALLVSLSVIIMFSILLVGSVFIHQIEYSKIIQESSISDSSTPQSRPPVFFPYQRLLLLAFFLMVIFCFASFLFFSRWLKDLILAPLDQIVESAFSPSMKDLMSVKTEHKEIHLIKKQFIKMRKLLEDKIQENLTQKEIETKYNISLKVAHDIRSPVMALKVVADNVRAEEKYKRLLLNSISRINDIAENILSENRRKNFENNFENFDLATQIKLLIEEKGNLFSNIIFEVNLDKKILVDFNYKRDLVRIFSNIIQNSCEAIHHNHGLIRINYYTYGNLHCLEVIDNGKGIPTYILPTIWGASYGKKNGNGLGLSYAKEYLNKINGSIRISSQESRGTSVSVFVPMYEAIQHPIQTSSIL